jgi:hypothetical protein
MGGMQMDFGMADTIPNDAKMKYKHVAIVRFRHRFPMDMLRYDRAMPFHESDAGTIERAFDSCDPMKVHAVAVMKYSEVRDWNAAWTFDRWKSFCCELVKPSQYKPEPAKV